ncbi:MAG TPA: aldolase/citrate lyase family protein [Acidimicrobiales bacterium]|nr:aldolase/citrate lyase family protein [Acidimicrobiales bacterium]
MLPGALVAEVTCASGCDWICIDQQHGHISDAEMRLMVQAAAIRRTPALVRVPWNEPGAIMRALDAGAEGIIVPMVSTVEEATRAVGASRYPPGGFRSWGALRAGMARSDYGPAVGNAETVCLVMIETIEGYENLDKILDVQGVDGVLVGPGDLAISHTGEAQGAARSSKDMEMVIEIAKACTRRGLVAAMSWVGADLTSTWIEAGYTWLNVPSDAAFLSEGVARTVDEVRAAAG